MITRPDTIARALTPHRTRLILRALGLAAGLAMLVIGLRFLFVPEQAAKFFGVGPMPPAHQLHHAVGLRDLWAGALAAAFALTRQWRALMLWFTTGALVCFGDAILVFATGVRPSAVAFHAISGLLCSASAYALWLADRRVLTHTATAGVTPGPI
jgi:Domain of unknown function (DUF4267)